MTGINHNRREFIKSASLGTASALSPFFGFSDKYFSSENNAKNTIKKVHLLFKTHLDIGFTDYAANVIDKYFNHYLPSALELAKNSRVNNNKNRFVWTTGSWLIYEYLEQANSIQRKTMEQAIEADDVIWHGLPFTIHTGLMSKSMLLASTNIAKVLDKRFGKQTISAKMTDVPGHTRSLVPVLQQNGIEMLHIGVNPASAVPDVPAIFNWRAPDGSETMVMYQGDYGGIMVLPDQQTAVSIVFTGDNHGPQSQKEIAKIYSSLEYEFPNAKIQASDLNKVTNDLKKYKSELPIITSEIGDTWIHGAGSDPLKIAQFREMARYREQLISSGDLIAGSKEDLNFTIPLAMVAEHTWGMDVKTFLKSWDIYAQDKFEASLNSEPFQNIEKSWQEKRNYLAKAVNSLPSNLAEKANNRLNELQPIFANFSNLDKLDLNNSLETRHFQIKFDNKTGAILSLIHKETERNWADNLKNLGLFAYQTFDEKDYERFHNQYLRSRPQWALYDFGKPGLETANPISKTWLSRVKSANKLEDAERIHVFINSEIIDMNGKTPLGCPAQIQVETIFPDNKPEIQINLSWRNKKAIRLPEALWFSFVPKLKEGETWTMDKSGQNVDPKDVVNNGARKLHGIQTGVWAGQDKSKITIESLDAPIVAPGERNLLNFDNALPKADEGIHFCLFNNVWGTNFTMWMDDDMLFRFKLKFDN